VAALGKHEIEVAIRIEVADAHIGGGFSRVLQPQRLRERSSGNLFCRGAGKDMQAQAASQRRHQQGFRHRRASNPQLTDGSSHLLVVSC
jgi:hypothetical protein